MYSVLFTLGLTFFWGCQSDAQQKPNNTSASTPTNEPSESKQVAEKVSEKQTESTTETITLFYQVGKNIVVWMSSHSGTIQVPVATSMWYEKGILTKEGSGYIYRLFSGINFYSPEKPTVTKPLADFMKQQGEEAKGYKITVKEKRNRFYVNIISPSGEQLNRKATKVRPQNQKWLHIPKQPSRGKISLPLPNNDKWQKTEKGKLLNLPPTDSKVIASKKADTSLLTTWTKELGGIRNGTVIVKDHLLADFDQDGKEEALVCVTGGKGFPCYIYDHEESINQYHPVEIRWKGGSAKKAPFAFSTDAGVYVAQRQFGSKNSLDPNTIKLIHFNGYGYITSTIQ